ncbi:hypothetical protein GGTG_06073 [Gaeumannomyces tritici R3-111a-1]|uniref:Uncharacterized protein n=1 Tax=Gaeumannomyces tritici (strain R3-111a-1) TaxID=644352 RepID=J3NXR9_GAET3|nr:hypothetical protein GGTG_06073 [Gaeumannomyces tritici R3-111a-1]EJT76151.1 hypothetical protein GGTG_06073 [Gaeumannomyces tritici R3-111a-1]
MVKEDAEFQNILATAENGVNMSFGSFHRIRGLLPIWVIARRRVLTRETYIFTLLLLLKERSTPMVAASHFIPTLVKVIAEWLGLEPSFIGPARFSAEVARCARKKIQDPVGKQFATGIFCPKRLIEAQSHPAKLVITENNPDITAPVYAALSYCWGTPKDAQGQLKTTREAICERTHVIHDYQMTAT